jgi:DNA-directed RNA polymerase subunit RPC12/RpoP
MEDRLTNNALWDPETCMNADLHSKQLPRKCARCNSDASYKFGKTRHGKQRFRCLLCGRQFGNSPRDELKERSLCHACGQKMHVYRKDAVVVRFRCAGYPSCRSFAKLQRSEYELLLSALSGEIGNHGIIVRGEENDSPIYGFTNPGINPLIPHPSSLNPSISQPQ